MKVVLCLALLAVVMGSVGVVAAGDLTKRLDLAERRTLVSGPPHYTDELIMADAIPEHVRRFTNFSGDVSGRYIGALAKVAALKDARYEVLDRIVTKLLPLQKPDGRFGDPMSTGAISRDDMALLWGNGRLLIGLVESYRLNKRPEVLESARRMGDFLVNMAPRLNDEIVREQFSTDDRFLQPKWLRSTGYICWTQCMEGLVALSEATSTEQYLRLAEQIADRTGRHPHQHTHGYLTSLRGVLAIYRATNNNKYLQQVEKQWQGIVDSGDVMVHGAVPEYWEEGTRDEGCSEADWLRLNLELWRLTRQPRYLEQAERTLFNEFAFNQFDTGDFGHFGYTTNGFSHLGARAWWCCTLHGLRAFPDIFATVFHEDQGVLYYDLPVDGQGKSPGLAVRAESALESDATIRLRVLQTDQQIRKLAVREPKWVKSIEISFSGSALPTEAKDGYLLVSRKWQRGDVITLRYRMRTHVVRREEPPPAAAQRLSRTQVAIFHGPWLLAVDDTTSQFFFDEPVNRVVLSDIGKDGELELELAVPCGGPRRAFTVPVAHFHLQYLPGGYPIQPGTALLRPIAEKTATPGPSMWRFWFTAASGAGDRASR